MGGGRARTGHAAVISVLLVAAPSSCVVGGTFVCSANEECAHGRCEPDGFCSFPDDACMSGHRYSEWAGNGRAEACTPADAATDASTDASTDATSTSFAPDLGPPAVREPSDIACGNGELEVGEPCDDGNLLDGDGCNHDCTVSGAILWTVIEDGPNSGEDYANAVALLADDDVVVAGRYGANAGDLFVKGYDGASGTLLWSKLQGTSLTEDGRALAVGDAARFYVAGFNSESEASGGENLFARAYDLLRVTDPDIAWTKSIDDAIQAADRIYGLALRPDRDELLAFGFLRGPDDTTTHVRAFQPDDGDTAWNVTPDIAPGVAQVGDEARAGVVTDDGRVYVAGAIVDPGEAGRTDGWVAELDVATSPDGVGFGPLLRIGTPEGVDLVSAIAAAPDGTLVVAGHRGQRGFFTRYDRELVEIADHVPDPRSPSEVLGVAVDGTGAIVTAGYTTSDAHGRDIEVVKYFADGTRIWRDRVDGGAGLDDVARGIAIGEGDTVLVVGNLRATVTGSDLWVRKYAP